MGKITVLLILIFSIPILLKSQVKELIFDNYSDNNRITDLKEDLDGNYIYVGEYLFHSEKKSSAFIAKISPEGEELKKVIFESEDLYRHVFDAIDIIPSGTYLVTGSESKETGSILVIMEFDKELNLIWKKSFVIKKGLMAVYYSILKKVTDGNYIMTFYGATREAEPGRCMVFKLSPTFDSIQLEVNTQGSGAFPIDFITNIDSGRLLMIESNRLYSLDYSDLRLQEEVEFVQNLYDDVRNIISIDTLKDGKIIYGASFDNFENKGNYSYLSICMLENSIYNPIKKGKSSAVQLKDLNYHYRPYSSDKNALDFIDEDNFIVGGSLNVFMDLPEDSFRPFMKRPSTLAIACFDKDLNLKWETFYEDGETSYYMMSMCATRDKGAIVGAIKCTYEQAVESKGDIVILKFDPHPDAVKEVIGKEVVKLYPNPACGNVTIDMGDCQEDCFVEVYDISGKLCMSDVILSGDGKKDMDVSKLQSGFYMVKINSGSEPAVTVKLSIKR